MIPAGERSRCREKLCFLGLLLAGCLLLPAIGQTQQPAPAQDREQQTAALRQKAEAGDAKAQVELGVAYAAGEGVPTDAEEAVKWFRKAAEQGDAAGEYALSEMYLRGRGVSYDFTEGLKWLQRSAEHGDARGQSNLAVLYLQGQGVPQDEAAAAKWMRKAADQGLAAGQFGLGMMYAHGSGVPKSESEAVTWYRKAAEQGDIPATNNLASLLATSSDAKIRNPQEAVSLAIKASQAESGNPTYLDTLATAFYEAGEVQQAVEAEAGALALSPNSESYQAALEKYRAAAASQAGKAAEPTTPQPQ